MILADENIDHSIIKAIRSIEIDVYSVYESNRGLSDFEIIEFSRNPPQIILTEDKDFGEWVFSHHIIDVSVIFLRYNFSETIEITNQLLNILKRPKSEFLGKFITISPQKIRKRVI